MVGKNKVCFIVKNTLDFTINTISKSNVKNSLIFRLKTDDYYRENKIHSTCIDLADKNTKRI